MCKPEEVFSVLQPMFYLTKIICLVPFSIKENRPHNLSWCNLVGSIFFIIFQMYFWIDYVANYDFTQYTIILGIINIVSGSTNNLSISVIIIINYVYYKEVQRQFDIF